MRMWHYYRTASTSTQPTSCAGKCLLFTIQPIDGAAAPNNSVEKYRSIRSGNTVTMLGVGAEALGGHLRGTVVQAGAGPDGEPAA